MPWAPRPTAPTDNAQTGNTNVNVPDPQVALAGKQAATGASINNDDSASALAAKQVGSGSATNTDDSASALLAKQVALAQPTPTTPRMPLLAKTAMPRLATPT